VLHKAALCPTAAAFWPLCVHVDVCTSDEKPPATDGQLEMDLGWKGARGCPERWDKGMELP